MKRSVQAAQTDIPDKQRKQQQPVKYSSHSDDPEDSDENGSGGVAPNSNLVTNNNSSAPSSTANSRPPGTAGKHPANKDSSTTSSNPATPTSGKLPPRPATAGKQPNPPKPLGTGGKQPDFSPQKMAEIKRTSTAAANNTGNKPSPGTAIKGHPPSSRPPPNESQTQSVRTGTGGKEPNRIDHNNKKQQPPNQQRYQASTSSSNLYNLAQGSNKARPQTPKKPHPLIGKTVKVFYVPDGYYTGVVRQFLGEHEFMIHWEDRSTTSATLKEEDETENSENEDRWSVVEDYEAQQPPTVRGKEKSGGNGAKTQKQTPPAAPPKQQQPPAPPPAQRPTPAFSNEDDEEENENENEPENDDNEPDENDT